MRRILSVPIALLVAALGAQIVGEYELRGYVPFLAGPLFGLVVAEVTVSVAGRAGMFEGATAVIAAGAGLGWGAWLSTSEGVEPWPWLAWAAIALGIAVAWARAGTVSFRSAATGARSSPPQPPRTPTS